MLLCVYFIYSRSIILRGVVSLISTRRCFYMVSYSIFANAAQGALNVALGVDRILWVVKENRSLQRVAYKHALSYDKWSTKWYITAMLTTVTVYGLLVTGTTFPYSSQSSFVQFCVTRSGGDLPLLVMCDNSTVGPKIWPISKVINAMLVVLTFVGAHLILKLRRGIFKHAIINDFFGQSTSVQAAPLFVMNNITIITFSYVVNYIINFILWYVGEVNQTVHYI
jgi:hypothetical protein